MRKIVTLISLVILLATTATAQNRRASDGYRPMYNYSGNRVHRANPHFNSLRFHVMAELGVMDVAHVFMHSGISHYGLGAMFEWEPARVFSLGVGANFDAGSNAICYHYEDFNYSVPVYVNLKLSTPTSVLRTFVEGRVGGAIPLHIADDAYSVAKGFYTGGGVGLSFYGSNISVGVNVTNLYHSNYVEYQWHDNVLVEYYLRYSYAFKIR